MYTLISSSTCVRRGTDEAVIPDDPANPDWQAYRDWLAAGNEPGAALSDGRPTAAVLAAGAALAASDITVLRCTEAGVTVPADWVAYRRVLRSVVAGGSSPLPDRPAYPAGT